MEGLFLCRNAGLTRGRFSKANRYLTRLPLPSVYRRLKDPSLMKRLLFFFVALFFFSCEPNPINLYNKMEGTWVLEKMQYTDVANQTQVITKPYWLLLMGYPERAGILKTDSTSYVVRQYSFGNGLFDLTLDKQRQLTGALIGKVQVYQYTLKGNTLTFSVDKEFDYPAGKLLKNVSYTFRKK